MIELTEEIIEKINKACVRCEGDQGIFLEPWGIPTAIKELVVYSRYGNGGYTGGDCWGGQAEPFYEAEPKDKMKVLDLLIKELAPELPFSKFNEIKKLIRECSQESEDGNYYGNSHEYIVEYIKISDILKIINRE
jgi:hypothetical protein